MRSRVLASTLLILLVLCSLAPLFLNPYLSGSKAMASNSSPPPPVINLNATGFHGKSSEIYSWNDQTSKGNSSLINVVVDRVNASDIGECKAGDLATHEFRVTNASGGALVFESNLEYNGTKWVALNFSLLPYTNMSVTKSYRVQCFFQRGLWTANTTPSDPFTYLHRVLIATPTFTYPTNTSDTIDVFVNSMRSSIWGKLNATTWITIDFRLSPSNITTKLVTMTYNATFDRWNLFQYNISFLVSGADYTLRVRSGYELRPPSHNGESPYSATFRFRGPYLLISTPEVQYAGRAVQLLNITVTSVWCSVHGYLSNANITFANYTITLVGSNASLINGAFLWNDTAGVWYIWNINISDYIQQSILHIGNEYRVKARFNSTITSRHLELMATSLYSAAFLLDRTPPNVTRTFVNPSPVTDEDRAYVSCTVTDDARISLVILSYYNGTHWVNVTTYGAGGKLANYTGIVPPFHERTVISYRFYVNDSQNAWFNSSLFTYTVADTPPLVANLVWRPELPTTAEWVTVTVTVTDGTAVATVTLYYSFGGAFTPVSMVYQGANRYAAQIPAYPAALNALQFAPVLFRIEASDVYNNTRVSSDYAYLVRGLLPAVDPAFGLFAVSAIALAIIVIIILVKIYERY